MTVCCIIVIIYIIILEAVNYNYLPYILSADIRRIREMYIECRVVKRSEIS